MTALPFLWLEKYGRMRPLFHQFDLFEIEFDRGRATEDRNRNFDTVLVEIQFLDHAIEAGEGTVQDLDLIANFIIDRHALLGCRCQLFLGVQDAGGFGFGDRLRLVVRA